MQDDDDSPRSIADDYPQNFGSNDPRPVGLNGDHATLDYNNRPGPKQGFGQPQPNMNILEDVISSPGTGKKKKKKKAKKSTPRDGFDQSQDNFLAGSNTQEYEGSSNNKNQILDNNALNQHNNYKYEQSYA